MDSETPLARQEDGVKEGQGPGQQERVGATAMEETPEGATLELKEKGEETLVRQDRVKEGKGPMHQERAVETTMEEEGETPEKAVPQQKQQEGEPMSKKGAKQGRKEDKGESQREQKELRKGAQQVQKEALKEGGSRRGRDPTKKSSPKSVTKKKVSTMEAGMARDDLVVNNMAGMEKGLERSRERSKSSKRPLDPPSSLTNSPTSRSSSKTLRMDEEGDWLQDLENDENQNKGPNGRVEPNRSNGV